MIKTKFHYESEDYDEEHDGDQGYQDGQDYEECEYYDDNQEYYDDDYIKTVKKRPNGPKEETRTQKTKQTTIYNKTVSMFEKRLLTLFKVEKVQILQYLDPRSIHNLYISCRLIKDTLGQLLWNEMCLKTFQVNLGNIKDIPKNLSYYLYYFLKNRISPFEVLLEYIEEPSTKLTNLRKFCPLYRERCCTLYQNIEPNLKKRYNIEFITKKYFLHKLDFDDDFMTFYELSYDLRPKQILKITTPKDISILRVRYLQGNIVQFQVFDLEDPDKLIFHYVHFSKLFESYKKNTVDLSELAYAKVSVVKHPDARYYTTEDDRATQFTTELTEDNELIVSYRDFETQFTRFDFVVFQNFNLLCLIDNRKPLLAFIDYTKPALVKVVVLKDVREMIEVDSIRIDINIIVLKVWGRRIEIQVKKADDGSLEYWRKDL